MATVTVKSVAEKGFCRCGMRFTKEPKTLVLGTDITSAQLDILRKEKMLKVEDIEITSTGGSGSGDDEKGLIEKIKTMTVVAELGKLLKDENRTAIMNVIKDRIKELKTK